MKLLFITISALIVLGFVFVIAPEQQVLAQSAADVCRGIEGAGGSCDDPSDRVQSVVSQVISVLSILVGIAAVIMIIIGGFKYITSSGDPSGAKSAKDTILYAVIGLVVAAAAQVIVRFVMGRLN